MAKQAAHCKSRWLLLLGALSPAFLLADTGDAIEGDGTFTKMCSGCHATDHTNNYYAPHLHCIIGRKAASVDFSGYSPDFKKVMQDVTWSEDLVFEFLRSPKEFVIDHLGYPSAQIMMNLELPDPILRKNVIAYLKSICKSE